MTEEFLSPADLLVRGLRLPALPKPPVVLERRTTCAITGQPLVSGYPVMDLVTSATGEFLDTFRGGVHGYVSETAARCFRSANPRIGNPTARSIVAFEDGTLWQPLIAVEQAAAQGRPAWRDLVRQVWPARQGQPCLLILTTNTKKRLWPRARIGALGARTPLFLYDGPSCADGIVFLSWPRLLACLDLVEVIYAQGFPKVALRQSLWSAFTVAQGVGLPETAAAEAQLRPWRERPEFLVAVLIAQRDQPVDAVAVVDRDSRREP